MNELELIIQDYLNDYVNKPVKQLIDNDIHTHIIFPTILVLLKAATDEILQHGIVYDKNKILNLSNEAREYYQKILNEFIKTGVETQEVLEIFKEIDAKKYIIFYIIRELNWAIISSMSASYISAYILMRSILELLINISTSNRESVGTRINNIDFFSEDEKKKLKKYWKDLNSWAHPYEHWVKTLCPIYISNKPLFHKLHCQKSIDYLILLIDFIIVIGIEKYEISRSIFTNKFIYDPLILKLDFLDNRLNARP